MLNGYKSYIGSGIIFLAGVVLLIAGQIDIAQFGIIAGNALGIAGLRNAIN